MVSTEESSATTGTKSRHEVTRRTISPYDLTASDNPGTVISRPALRGHNYDEWSASIRLALKARKKFGFVDGSIYSNHLKILKTMKIGVPTTLLWCHG